MPTDQPRTCAEGRAVIARCGVWPERRVIHVERTDASGNCVVQLSCMHKVQRSRVPHIRALLVCDRCAERIPHRAD